MLDSFAVRSFDDERSTLAVSRTRDDETDGSGAQVIDLVYLPSGARPQPRAELEYDEVLDARILTCSSYNDCLAFAAEAHWRGFHCRRCPKFAGLPGEPLCANADEAPGQERGLAPVIRLRR